MDRKREELRVMVGERYRDLIEAADTIHHMRGCTHAVIQSVAAMTQAAAALKLAPGLGRPRAGHSGGGGCTTREEMQRGAKLSLGALTWRRGHPF